MTAVGLVQDVVVRGTGRERLGPPDSLQRGEDAGLAKIVQQRWTESGEQLARARRNYWINLAFYLGQHWVGWSNERNTVRLAPQDYSPLGRGRVRLTINRYAPNLTNVLGRLSRRELAFEIPPSDTSDSVVLGARKGEKVLEATARVQGWDSYKFDTLLAAMLGGTSGLALEWDPYAGRHLRVDNATDRVISTGDVRLMPLNINEMAPEANVRHYQDMRHWTMGVALPAAAVKEQYQLGWIPRADAFGRSSTFERDLTTASTSRAQGKNLTMVLTHYERPLRGPGLYVVVVNGAVVHRSDWPFPFDDTNLTLFRQKRVDGTYIGDTYCNDAVPVQAAYNFARSMLSEHMKLAGNAKFIAPAGSMNEDDLYGGRAGSVVFYTPDGSGTSPGWVNPPNLPRWLTQEASDLAAELDEIMHVHDISRGIGFQRAAAQALQLLSEQDDSALSPMVFDIKHGWERIAGQALQMFGSKVSETRVAKLRAAPGIGERIEWNGKALQGQYDVTIPLDVVVPRTHAAAAQNAKDLWDRHIVTDPRIYARMSGLPPDSFEELLDADAAKANRENLRIAQGYVEIPDPFDDNAIHISEHNRWRKSDAYKYAEPEIRSIMDDHVAMHEQVEHEQFAKQMARAQVNPALPGVAQGAAPPGSELPMPAVEQRALVAGSAPGPSGAAAALPAPSPGGP